MKPAANERPEKGCVVADSAVGLDDVVGDGKIAGCAFVGVLLDEEEEAVVIVTALLETDVLPPPEVCPETTQAPIWQ